MTAVAMPWRERGACVDVDDPELFFPEQFQSAEPAKAICAGCPVREMCLAFAVKHGEAHGVWGGLEPAERADLVRARRDGDRAA